MKAIQCVEYGNPELLQLNEIDDPIPGKGEVVINVKAASVNFPDSLIIQGLYQFKPPVPFTPGGDVAGIVEAVGENVKHVKVGDKVFGSHVYGGFAEKMVVPGSNCVLKPEMLDDGIAASFMIAYGTSIHALKDRAQLKPGETLLVLGASGGVGLAAVEIGKGMGATVIAAASSEEKLALCVKHGASHTINYSNENLKERIKELTDSKGVDVIYDPVGGEYSEPALRGMAWGGRFLVVGFAAGSIPKIALNLALLKGCSIVGVFWGSFATRYPKENLKNILQLMDWYKNGVINPHIHKRYPLKDTPLAIRALMDRKVSGKVIIEM